MPQRLNITPAGLDLLLALSQRPAGARLSELADILAKPLSSVQSALRPLIAYGVVHRIEGRRPRYRAVPDHPARADFVRLAGRLAEPGHAIEVLLRANEAIVSAWRDDDGFITAERATAAGLLELLQTTLDDVRRDRAATPAISRFGSAELSRLLDVALDLRTRVASARVLKAPGRGDRTDPSLAFS